jgi:peptidyl-prolyl cis-trans isomerase SurA
LSKIAVAALLVLTLFVATRSTSVAQTAGAGKGAPASSSRPVPGGERLDGIAAVVNDDVILESDVEEQLYLFISRLPQPPDSSQIDTLRNQILDQLIDEKLIVAEAKKQGVTASEADVNQQIDQAIGEAKERLGGEEGFRRQLEKENTTEAKLREKYRSDLQRQLVAQRLIEKTFPKSKRPVVTAVEAEAYYKSHPDKFPKVPAEVKVQVIQIPAEADSTRIREARLKALAARKRIVAGEKFAKVAGEVSEDPNSARSGGDLGFLPKGALDRPLDEAVWSLKDHELSQPVRSAVGWHILEVIERDTLKTAAGRDSLDEDGRKAMELHIRHILVRVAVGEEDVARARALAEKVHAEAVKGGDFAALVRKYSKYEGKQDGDGDLGFISLGTLQPTIRAGLDAVPVGQVSDVLENQTGFNIFKVNDKKPERQYEIAEIKDELPEVVGQIKNRERYEDWVKGLRSKAHIDIRNS